MDKYELLAALRQLDEITLLELLEINSVDLVDAFLDNITDNWEQLSARITDDQ